VIAETLEEGQVELQRVQVDINDVVRCVTSGRRDSHVSIETLLKLAKNLSAM
jgi:hypothetical protein